MPFDILSLAHVIHNNEKSSKQVGRFQGLSNTFNNPDQILGLFKPGKHDFKAQGLSRICTKPGNQMTASIELLTAPRSTV